MKSIINNVNIINTAHISIQLESQEDIDAFKDILNKADARLNERYVDGGNSLTKTMIDLFKDELKNKGL